jgi:hypothetical protein
VGLPHPLERELMAIVARSRGHHCADRLDESRRRVDHLRSQIAHLTACLRDNAPVLLTLGADPFLFLDERSPIALLVAVVEQEQLVLEQPHLLRQLPVSTRRVKGNARLLSSGLFNLASEALALLAVGFDLAVDVAAPVVGDHPRRQLEALR